MPALSIYSNVENTALVILTQKGYQVWRDKEKQFVYAEKDGWDFAGQSFAELLGAVSIFEWHSPAAYAEYWWRIREPWLLDEVPQEPRSPFTPVWEKHPG